MPLPGKMPRMRDYAVVMLPSDIKKPIYEKNTLVAMIRLLSWSLSQVSNKYGLSIYRMLSVNSIASDLCETCQSNNNLIMKSVSCSEEEIIQRLKAQEKHLHLAKECRDHYRMECQLSKKLLGTSSQR